MTEYVTTNIRLPKELYRQAKRRALEEEKSFAEVIRESVVQYLIAEQPHEQGNASVKPGDEESDPLWLIGTDPIEGDVTDASTEHDCYLYGPHTSGEGRERAG